MRPSREVRRAGLVMMVAVVLGSCGDGAVGPDAQRWGDLAVAGGGSQRGLAGRLLPAPIAVQVLDTEGQPVAGVRVRFDVVSGGGEALPSTGVTDSWGRSATRWRLGSADTRTQQLRATIEGATDGPSVLVEATALGLEEADRVVVHGALGPLKGFVLITESDLGVEIGHEEVTTDTVLILQPQDVPGVDVVLFAPSNRPLREHPSWTSGPDTVHVTLQPPVAVTYVTSIDNRGYDGWGCWSGQVFMSLRAAIYPYLLAHELGHTFTLEHTADGLMYPSNPGVMVRDGETFRAHFHGSSVLNTIFGSQPESMRRACARLPAYQACLPDDYRLTVGAASVVATRAPASAGPRRGGRPLDNVEPPPTRPPRRPPSP